MAWVNTQAGSRNFMQDPDTYQGEGIARPNGSEYFDEDVSTDEFMRQAFQSKLAGNDNAFNFWKDYLKTRDADGQLNNYLKDQSYNQLLSETVTNGKPSEQTIKNVYRVLGEQGYSPEQINTEYVNGYNGFIAGERERANRHHDGFSGFLEKVMPAVALGIVTGGIGYGTGLLGAGLGAGVDSEIGALANDAAIQAGLGEGAAQVGSGTSLSADAITNRLNPYYGVGADATNPLLTNAGYGSTELGGTGSIVVSGTGLGVSTLGDVSAATGFGGLTGADFPSYDVSNAGNGVNANDIAKTLRLANTAKNVLTPKIQVPNAQNAQALSNLLRANQFKPTEAPAIYKAQNPFSFGEQQPIQGQMASLLRNNYGN